MARKSGSATARGGFDNEASVLSAFEQDGRFRRRCLTFMGFGTAGSVEAIHIPFKLGAARAMQLFGLCHPPSTQALASITTHQKADIRLRIATANGATFVNLSLKKANASANFNQVDKHRVGTYRKFWGFDEEIELWLRIFTGAATPDEFARYTMNLKVDEKRRRVGFRYLPPRIKSRILEFLDRNRHRIVEDVLRGRGRLAADYIIVTQHAGTYSRAHICQAGEAIRHLMAGTIREGPRSSIRLGKICIQRYGGSPHPELLQFKIRPSDLFDAYGETMPTS